MTLVQQETSQRKIGALMGLQAMHDLLKRNDMGIFNQRFAAPVPENEAAYWK
jgi:hypothetical protein